MQITKLEATSIKGQTISLEPKPVTIIAGPNYSGKSAIKNALELALLGYVPGLGKKNQAIFELSNGEPMGVELSVDGKVAFSRLWSRNSKGVKCDNNSQDFEIDPVMLELESVFGRTKAERLNYFFNLARVDLTPEKITAKIKAIKVDEPTEATEKAIASVAGLAALATGENIQEQLGNAQVLIKDRTKSVSDELKDHFGFTRTMTRQTDEQLQTPVNNARQKVEVARKAQGEAREKQAACERALDELKKMQIALDALGHSTEMPDLPEPQLRPEELEDDGVVAGIEAEIEATQAEIEQVKPFCDVVELRKAQEIVNSISGVVGKHEAELSALLHTGNIQKKQIAEAKAVREADAAMECCPTCLADGVSWKDRLLEKHDREIRELICEFNDSKEQYCRTREELITVKTSLESATQIAQELGDHQNALNDLHGKLQLLSADRNKLIYAQQKEVERIRQGNESRKAGYQQDLQRMAERIARANAERDNLTAKIAAINEDELRANLESAELNLRGASNALDAADTALQQETARYAREKELMKSLLRRDQVEAELLILKEAAKVLLSLQEESVASAFAPLLETANLFTSGILREPLDFHDGDMGYWRDGAFVSHRTFSGTEEALAYTGLMVALANASGSPLKVAIIDEMGRFDPKVTRPAVVGKMMDLTRAGVIDHAFLIDNDVEYYRDTTWENNERVLIHEVTA